MSFIILFVLLCSTAVSVLIIYPALVLGGRDDNMVRVAIPKHSQDLARLKYLVQADSSVRNLTNTRLPEGR